MSRYTNPVPQYLDDAGDPLVAGLLYTYESGTNTLKTTYADVNLSVANSNPVVLTGSGRCPNVFYDGTAKQVLTSAAAVQIWERDPVGSIDSTGNFTEWNPLVVYATDAIVQGSDGNFYISLQAGNVGEDPTTTPSFWEQIDFIRIWNTNVTYDVGSTVKASDNLFYRGLTAANLGNDPVGDSVNWGSISAAVSFDPIAPYAETLATVGTAAATTIDTALGSVFDWTLPAASSVTITSGFTTATADSFALKISGGDSYAVTWPASVTEWKGGAAPTLTAIHWITFITDDAGTTWTGFDIGEVAAP